MHATVTSEEIWQWQW